MGADSLSASTTLSGYVSTSYHGGTGSGKYPYALSHENRSSFTLDVVGLSFQRPLDEWLWDTGFRVDLWLGPQASDLGTSANANDTVVLLPSAVLTTPQPGRSRHESTTNLQTVAYVDGRHASPE